MHCSAAQGKLHSPPLRLTTALCHWNHTFQGLLFTQVCSEPAQMHCRTGQNAFPIAQCRSADQADSSIVSLQTHIWASPKVCSDPSPRHCRSIQGTFTYKHTQVCSDPTLMQCNALFGKTIGSALQKQADSSLANTCKDIGCSYRYYFWQNAVPNAQGSSAKQADSSLVSLELHLTSFVVQTCVQCNTVFGKKDFQLLRAALQNRLTGLCHWNHIWENLLFIRVCSDPATMQCSIGFWQNAIPTVQCCSHKQAHSKHCVTSITPMKICNQHHTFAHSVSVNKYLHMHILLTQLQSSQLQPRSTPKDSSAIQRRPARHHLRYNCKHVLDLGVQ